MIDVPMLEACDYDLPRTAKKILLFMMRQTFLGADCIYHDSLIAFTSEERPYANRQNMVHHIKRMREACLPFFVYTAHGEGYTLRPAAKVKEEYARFLEVSRIIRDDRLGKNCG